LDGTRLKFAPRRAETWAEEAASVVRFRPGKKTEKTARPDDGTPSAGSSRVDDLTRFVDEHMLRAEHMDATTKWYPSRRGNSPRAADRPERA
jgi:hypothetical protein